MTTRATPAERRQSTSAETRDLLGRIRRMVATLTSGPFWQVVGHTLLDGSTETREAEIFGGVGISARPPASSQAEVIVVFPGGATQPIVVASRDEATRRAIAGALAADETAVFNSRAIAHFKAAGTVEIRSQGGTAVALATKADLLAILTAIDTAVTALNTASNMLGANALNALKGALTLSTWPLGTTVLKAE